MENFPHNVNNLDQPPVKYSEYELAMMTNQDKANLLIDIYDREAPQLSDFRGQPGYPDYMINSDERYVATKEAAFRQKRDAAIAEGKYIPDDCDYHPKALEAIMRFGIGTGGNWFENLSGDADEYRSRVVPVTRYDDICNKIDLSILVSRPPEYTDEFTPEQSIFGIDFTTSSNPREIQLKLLRSTNDRKASLEIGEGQLKYCQYPDGQMQPVPSLPRYCVGLSRPSIDGMLDQVSVAADGRITIGNRVLKPHHKMMILYEIYRQNLLFSKAIIAKSANREATEHEESTLALFENIDSFLHTELDKCSARIQPGTYSTEVANSLRNYDKTFNQIITTISTLEDDLKNGRTIDASSPS